MTAIVWDGETLAVDSLFTINDQIINYNTPSKIQTFDHKRYNKCLFAGYGPLVECEKWVSLFQTHDFQFESELDMVGILITRYDEKAYHVYLVTGGGGSVLLRGPAYLGVCDQLGHYLLGKGMNAVDIVRELTKVSTQVGGPIRAINLTTKEAKEYEND